MRATVLVRPRAGILDPQGQAVSSSLRHLGFDVVEARVGRLIDVDLRTDDPGRARAELERMCEQLLANPLIESYAIELDVAVLATKGDAAGAGSVTDETAPGAWNERPAG